MPHANAREFPGAREYPAFLSASKMRVKYTMNNKTLPTFDPNKPVRCRSGAQAEIFKIVDGDHPYPIYGRRRDSSDHWTAASWMADGTFDAAHDSGADLVNVPRQGECWVNVYGPSRFNPAMTLAVYSSRDLADADPVGRLACIHAPWVEGMGLSAEWKETIAAEALCQEKSDIWTAAPPNPYPNDIVTVAEAARAEITEQARSEHAAGAAQGRRDAETGVSPHAIATSPLGRTMPPDQEPGWQWRPAAEFPTVGPSPAARARTAARPSPRLAGPTDQAGDLRYRWGPGPPPIGARLAFEWTGTQWTLVDRLSVPKAEKADASWYAMRRDANPGVKELANEITAIAEHNHKPERLSCTIDWTSGVAVLDHISELRARAVGPPFHPNWLVYGDPQPLACVAEGLRMMDPNPETGRVGLVLDVAAASALLGALEKPREPVYDVR